MEAAEVAVQRRDDGALKATGSVPSRLSCEGDALMKLETDGTTVLLGIPMAGDWNCQAALQRWATVSRPDEAVGVRYSPAAPGTPETATLISENGESMFLAVRGAWQE